MFGLATSKEIADLQRQINELKSGGTLNLHDEERVDNFLGDNYEKLHSEPVPKQSYPTGSDKVSIAIRVRAAKTLRKQKKSAKEISEMLQVTPGTVRDYWKRRG